MSSLNRGMSPASLSQETSHAFLLLLGTIFCVFFFFTACGTALSWIFPTQLAHGTVQEINRFYLFVKIKVFAQIFLSGLIFAALIFYSRKKSLPVSFDSNPAYPGEKQTVLWGWVFFLLAALFSANSILTGPTGNDEGMYANVARNFALYSRYALNYFGQLQDFSPYISVGPTVIFPLALIYKYAGDGMIWTRFYTFLWFLVALPMIYRIYARFCQGHRLLLALFLALLYFHTAKIENAISEVMGEIPALFFLLCSLSFLPAVHRGQKIKGRFFLSGLFLGLAIVTKTTLIIFMPVPLIGLLYFWFAGKEKTEIIKCFLAGCLGMVIPALFWFLTASFLTNTSVSHDNFYNYSQFLLFRVSGIIPRIFQFGPVNFFRLALLFLAASCFIQRALEKGKLMAGHLAMYTFSLYFILWFFTCTDGHFVRYTTYAVFLLIPLAVSLLPEVCPWQISFTAFALILILFYPEAGSIMRSVTLKPRSGIPWMSVQLKEKLKSYPGISEVWTVNEFDERYLSVLKIPVAVRLMPETLKNRGLNEGDVLAVGVVTTRYAELRLYLLRVLRVPEKPVNAFYLQGEMPEELRLSLQKYLSEMSVSVSVFPGSAPMEPDGYLLELFPDEPPAP